jgi:diguanylate cyclase (GGDEF)-like protein
MVRLTGFLPIIFLPHNGEMLAMLRRLILRLPAWVPVAAVVAISMALSVSLVLLSTYLQYGHWIRNLSRWIGIALLVPAMVATPISWLVVRLVHEVDAAREAALELAWRDDLTSLLSRRRFVELSELELGLNGLRGDSFALALFDLDDFKDVNDRYGHVVGDHLLCAAAKACRGVLRPVDLLGRWGGEEFAIALPGLDSFTAAHTAEQIRIAVESAFVNVSGQTVRCTASIGVAVTQPQPESFDDLIRRADSAMYNAKRRGKNRVILDFAA